MPGLDPLLVGVGPPQPAAEIVDLAFQEFDPAFLALRRAADFLGLLLGSPQLVSAGVELGLQRTRPGTRGHLCPAQFFTARFRRLRTRPFPLVQRPPVARRADAVCEGDQIPSSPSASVRSAPKSSPRIDMRSTVAHGRIRYQHQISRDPAIPRPPNSYISIEPLFAEAHRNLAIARRHVEVDEDVRRTRRLMDIEMNEVATMHAEFALAKIDDDLGEIDDAFTHLSRANRLKRRSIQYDVAQDRIFFERLKRTFDPAFFSAREGWGEDDTTPIFIVGMPRSGTTLVEQIIASHPRAWGAGETLDLDRLLWANRGSDQLQDWCETMASLAKDDMRELAADYLTALKPSALPRLAGTHPGCLRGPASAVRGRRGRRELLRGTPGQGQARAWRLRQDRRRRHLRASRPSLHRDRPGLLEANPPGIIRGRVDLRAVINSDGWGGYDGLVDLGYGHFRVDHSSDEFTKGAVHINGIEGFWGLAKVRLASGADRITDKTPRNFHYIGMIRVMLPRAKIVNCIRNPLDMCFSCFQTYFTRGIHFANELRELGIY